MGVVRSRTRLGSRACAERRGENGRTEVRVNRNLRVGRVGARAALTLAALLVACGGPAEEEVSVLTGALSSPGAPPAAGTDGGHLSPLAPGPFLVGSRPIFVRDPARRFDPWNEIYGAPAYQALLAQLRAIGEPRTLVTEVWYPVTPPPGCHPRAGCDDPRCLPRGARRATYLDYYLGDRGIFDRRGVSPYLVTAGGETVAALAARDPAAHAALVADVLDELAGRARGSLLDAPVAEGRFPLVVMSHGGFTGLQRPDAHREIFTSQAERLASHGYVVVAMNHTGDSRLPTVFHDAGSALRRTGGQAAVDAAYEILFAQAPVPDRITGLIFQPGGFPLANTMMQRLFELRTDDVVSVIAAVRALEARRGSFLHGRVDLGRAAVAGFSLGSMTTQIALSSVPGLRTGMSWNNGLPRAWEPPRFRGLTRPHFFSLATEDELSRTFFTNVPFLIYPSVVPGGQPSDFLFLPEERVFPPTRDNPEPVVRACYGRAAGPKLLLGLVDSTHWDVTDYDDYLFPRHQLAAGEIRVAFDNLLRRLPFGPQVLDPGFVGAPFRTMSWERTRHGDWVYRPHVIRDYYAISWYGLYLKGVEGYRRDLARDPFGGDITVLQQGVSSRP
jgi:dienelactone hydrolase